MTHTASGPNILFLDVDGVCNNTTSETLFDKFNLNNVKVLIERLNLVVIISSDWRRNQKSLNLLRSELRGLGIKIHGTTKITNSRRCEEIKDWLDENAWAKALIVDDMTPSEVDPKVANCVFHRTQHHFGLTEEDVDKIVANW